MTLVTVPTQLRGFRLVKTRPNKLPMEKGYNTEGGANYAWNEPSFLAHLAKGGSYGVLCGMGTNLTVVDFDDEDAEKRVLPHFPETFLVRTPNKGRIHAYFIMPDGGETLRLKTPEGKSALDVQGNKKYVLGPNSPHEKGGFYKVVNDAPIATFSYLKLKEILRSEGLTFEEEAQETGATSRGYNSIHEIPIRALATKLGVSLTGNRGKCPFCNDPNDSFVILSSTSACCFACPGKAPGKQAKGWSSISFYRQAKAEGLLNG